MKINDCVHQKEELNYDNDTSKPWCKKIGMVCPNKPKHCEWYKKKTIDDVINQDIAP